jgi:hypothetical protein
MLNRNNSFPCNLPHQLEKEKLYNTTKLITEKLKKPICYKAGRYGIGKNTPTILKEYGYKIDLSVFPTRSFKNREGPDFKKFPTNPFWLDEQKTLLELPMSAGYTGFLKSQGSWISSILENSLAKKAYLPAILARLKLFDHITLTPEGMTLEEAILLTKTLYESGTRIFTFSYHSSSLQIGQTPYVRDKEDLKIFLQRIKDYLKFFQDFGGDFTTAENLYEALKK